MLLLGVLLAAGLITLVVVLTSCELQSRTTRRAARRHTIPNERERFDELVAPLEADPDFGRIDL